MELVIPARICAESATSASGELAVESFVATECEGMARIDFFVRPDGEVDRERDQHDPGLHVDERLREAVRGSRHPVRRAARPAHRARARAPRAPRVASY